jgi:medium-chain acyl-[acyl-carrier-protein] hydrolase
MPGWIAVPAKSDPQRLRLICAPYAGGAASEFHGWAQRLRDVQVCPVHLPGRQSRIAERALTSMDAIVGPLLEAMRPLAEQPYALFGHSLGALVVFELARALRRIGAPPPLHLIAAGCRAPQRRYPYPPIVHLSDAQFIDGLRRLHGTPAALLANAELMQMMLPTLRADFQVCETYAYRDEPPLACPIVAFGGLADPGVTRLELSDWQQQTTDAFRVEMLTGGHFFVESERDDLLDRVDRQLHQ